MPTPVVQVTVQPTVRPTAEAVPTPKPAPTRTPTPTAVPTATAVPTPAGPPVFPVDPTTVVPAGTQLQDPQEIRVPNGHGGVAPWRDGGGQRIFSPWVYGTVYQIDEFGVIRPYIGISHTVNEDKTVWTVKLREDAVFQDGTPITAADFKAYWEHGARPENIVAWGGASLSIGDILGWEELRAGDVTEAEGLVVIDDQTLEVTTVIPFPTWPLAMAAWHSGISKLEQVLEDEEWFTHPIGAGPYKWTTDPDTRQYVAEADAAEFWGPSPNIKKLHGLNITDNQVQGDHVRERRARPDVDRQRDLRGGARPEPSVQPAAEGHPVRRPVVHQEQDRHGPAGGPAGTQGARARRGHALHRQGRLGPDRDFATGLISPLIPCHNPDAPGHIYDPELARQELATSSYGSAEDLPPLLIDLARPLMVNMGVAVKEYWKDNLGIDLDILKRESGMPRREASQFYRISLGSWIPDPVQIVSNLTRTESWYSRVLDALVEHARSLPLDDPERCAAFQAVEEEYMDKVYMLPIRWVGGVKWVVQPWVVGFESTSNLDINTLPWMYVLQH